MADFKMPEMTKEGWIKFLHEEFFNTKPFIEARKERDDLPPKIRAKYDKIIEKIIKKVEPKEDSMVGKEKIPKGVLS